MKPEHAPSIADLAKLAKKALPRVMFDYLEGAAEDERTASRNLSSFQRYRFKPRVLRDVSSIDLSCQMLGSKHSVPFICAPTGLTRMFHHEGERAVAKACHNMGVGYTLSTVATTSIEDVAALTEAPLYFQIYAWKNQAMIDDFITRCQKSGYRGLMLAVDLAALGKRDRDLRNGHGRPKALRLNTAKTALQKPGWLWNYLTQPAWRMANMIEHLPHGAHALKVVDRVNEQFDAGVTWNDVKAMQEQWQGSFVLKGIQSVADAKLAKEHGVDAIILSNHGGRQLDGAPTALDILPDVVKAVGNEYPVYIDGGIRRGSDIIKALCLGAKGCLIGRAYLYGLAAGGRQGVERSLTLLIDEMERTMRLLGCSSIEELSPEYIEELKP